MAPASAPAHSRRARSFMVAFSRRHLSRTVRSASTTPEVDHAGPSAVDPQRSILSATRSTRAFAGPKRILPPIEVVLARGRNVLRFEFVLGLNVVGVRSVFD